MKFTLNFLADSGEMMELTVIKAVKNLFNVDENILFLRPDEYAQFEAMTGDPARKTFLNKIPKASRVELA